MLSCDQSLAAALPTVRPPADALASTSWTPRDDVDESALEHQLAADLPGQDRFEEDAPGLFRLAGIVWIESFEALLDFRFQCGERGATRQPGRRGDGKGLTTGIPGALPARTSVVR